MRWLDQALVDAADITAYYSEIDLELADALWSAVRAQIALLQRFPGAGLRVGRVADVNVRRLLTDRFPYAVVRRRRRVSAPGQRTRPGRALAGR